MRGDWEKPMRREPRPAMEAEYLGHGDDCGCGCQLTNAQWRAEAEDEQAIGTVDFDGKYTSADWMPDDTILVLARCSCRHSISSHAYDGCASPNCDCSTPLGNLARLIKVNSGEG